MRSQLSTYAHKQKATEMAASRWELQIAKSRHSKIFSVRSGIEMSMMRRQTEISIMPSSHTHKEIPVSVAVTSTAPKLPDDCDRCANLWNVLPNLNNSSVYTTLQQTKLSRPLTWSKIPSKDRSAASLKQFKTRIRSLDLSSILDGCSGCYLYNSSFFNYDFNYKISEFLTIINGVFVVCMLSE